jgi:hypothetical protein
MAIGNNIMAIGNNNQGQITATKFPNHRFPCSQCLLLVVCWACSLVRAFPALSLSPRRRTLAGWLSGLSAFLSLSRAAAAELPFLLGHQQPTNATGSVCSPFLPVSLSAHYDYNTRIRKLTSSLLFRFERKVSSFPLFLFLICYYTLFYFGFLFSYSVRARLWLSVCVCVCVCARVFFFFGVRVCAALVMKNNSDVFVSCFFLFFMLLCCWLGGLEKFPISCRMYQKAALV